MATRKPINPAWLLIPLVMGIFIFSAVTWLSTPDSYTSPDGTVYTITGWEVLDLQHSSFFVWVWIGFFGTLVFGTLAYLNETGAWIGKYLQGRMEVTVTSIILALACLIVPWIPALTAKVDGGQFSKPQTYLYESSPIKDSRTTALPGHINTVSFSSNDLLPTGRQNRQSWATRLEDKKDLACSCRRTAHLVWGDNGEMLRMGMDFSDQ